MASLRKTQTGKSIRAGRNQKPRVLVFCEGETEKGYFKEFKVRCIVCGKGNALHTVQEAIAKKPAVKDRYDYYWIVFDKDDTPHQQYNDAIRLAKEQGFATAASNEAFELWFLYHFIRINRCLNRSDYPDLLKKYLHWYDEHDKGEEQGKKLYIATHHLIHTAISHADVERTSAFIFNNLEVLLLFQVIQPPKYFVY